MCSPFFWRLCDILNWLAGLFYDDDFRYRIFINFNEHAAFIKFVILCDFICMTVSGRLNSGAREQISSCLGSREEDKVEVTKAHCKAILLSDGTFCILTTV